MTRVDDDELAGHCWPAVVQPFVFAQLVGFAADHRAHELTQRPEGRRPAGAVGGQADVALEFAKRILGTDAEHPVCPAAVEAHIDQAVLQRGDVVADVRMPHGERQGAIAKPPARFVERPIGLAIDDAIDAQAALLLKAADGVIATLVEDIERWCASRRRPILPSR